MWVVALARPRAVKLAASLPPPPPRPLRMLGSAELVGLNQCTMARQRGPYATANGAQKGDPLAAGWLVRGARKRGVRVARPRPEPLSLRCAKRRARCK